jgi:hypothetical protein
MSKNVQEARRHLDAVSPMLPDPQLGRSISDHIQFAIALLLLEQAEKAGK